MVIFIDVFHMTLKFVMKYIQKVGGVCNVNRRTIMADRVYDDVNYNNYQRALINETIFIEEC